jgi:integrase
MSRVLERFKARRIFSTSGINFAASPYLFAGIPVFLSPTGFSICGSGRRARLGMAVITAHGLRHSAATILLAMLGKDLREIQKLLRTGISAPRCATPIRL